jgi:hypothetical protein
MLKLADSFGRLIPSPLKQSLNGAPRKSALAGELLLYQIAHQAAIGAGA